ncbi:MAG: Carboxypeptidase Taq (M32) metallopeptidase [Methanocella sp. PtaU1.Bin125]|nr:MAG: Carboxypeptidase Taq (M32) metallopeptidase [Methanocella sp. PtaU1.Bin125]
MATSSEYRELLELIKEINTLEQVGSLLDWDQQTYMPPGAFRMRGEQNALIAGLIHERLTSDRMGKLIRALKKQELSADGRVILREVERKWKKASSVPAPLVKEISITGALAFEAWGKARKNSDFKSYVPLLDKMIGLKQKQAECIGYEDKPYDALLDDYEPGMKTRDVEVLFKRLIAKLVPITRQVLDAPAPKNAVPAGKYPLEDQRRFLNVLAAGMGYDLNCGRIDLSAHPFTNGGGKDVRITFRYQEDNPIYSIFPIIHEAGHALYEQGFQEKYFGTPLAEAVSMGFHESQSRLWENVVGRSLPFWQYYYPQMQQMMPKFQKVPLDAWLREINRVTPSYIRTEADELTYNLHIALRFEAEAAIFDGRLKTKEIPAFWNERFERYLGIPVRNDAEGCLQDVHWSAGGFGYFPSYTMGNLYAAQLWHAAKKQVPGIEDGFAKGDLSVMLGWLRKNVHRHGKRYSTAELMKRITGDNISEDYFIRYVSEKYGRLYDIKVRAAPKIRSKA